MDARPIELARRLAELSQTEEAQRAYTLVLRQGEKTPEEEMEAASFLFYSGGDYRLAYTSFVSLFNRGYFQAELLNLMSQAFYLPNADSLKERYEKNCRTLTAYPYLFQKDFPAFEDLPLWFFPYDDESYIPYSPAENRFGDWVDFNDPVIDRYFFRDLEKPVLAGEVYSQYHLDYLNDTVRKSEWVGRENHIYLHYQDFKLFCAYLQVLEFTELVKDEKFVFLFGDEIAQYPMDFKERFCIDYSQYPVKPVGVREVNRMIWHTQLATHNGGDFFNEIFHGHPNLLAMESLMFKDTKETMDMVRGVMRDHRKVEPELQQYLWGLKHPTDKDLLVALFMSKKDSSSGLDPAARIAPALFFQPHFANLNYDIDLSPEKGGCILSSRQYEQIRSSRLFREFKYIKTFTPLRRPTGSYGATIRFMLGSVDKNKAKGEHRVMDDQLSVRLLNRSYYVDQWDRLYRDSVLVRFEDGKMNPRATFTALAEFLDLPYTESMTYCSGATGINPESLKGNDLGFDLAALHRTYEDFCNDDDRAMLEYFLRDIYETYGYDFHYYKGEAVDDAWIEEKAKGAAHLNELIRKTHSETKRAVMQERGEDADQPLSLEMTAKLTGELAMQRAITNRVSICKMLQFNLPFVSKDGQPLHMMPLLKLDPELLEQPLYR